MKPYKDLKLSQGTDKWKKWRQESGVGGSEIASVLAMDSSELASLVYTPPLKLHLLKIGEPVQAFTGNVQSMEGQYQESMILDRFKYWDFERPEALQMCKNRAEGKILNKIFKVNTVFWREDYPQLFYSPDGLYMKEKQRVGLLESKLTTSMEANRYKNKVNPSFYMQVQLGLMITELPVGFALLLIDGQWFEVVAIYPDPEIHEWIKDCSYRFWRNVLEARKIKLEYGIPSYFGIDPETLTHRQQEGVQLLYDLEPQLVGSEAEVKFVKEMIIPQPERIERQGTIDEKLLAIEYKRIGERAKDLAAEKNKVVAELLRNLNGCNVVNFDTGYYSYLPDKNGKCSIYVSPKVMNE